jgi:hypothetical protein
MQGGRSNVGRKTTPMSGPKATRMSSAPQPQPRAVRPQAATPDVPRSGSRVVVGGDPVGAVTQPQPAGSGSAGGAYTRGED